MNGQKSVFLLRATAARVFRDICLQQIKIVHVLVN